MREKPSKFTIFSKNYLICKFWKSKIRNVYDPRTTLFWSELRPERVLIFTIFEKHFFDQLYAFFPSHIVVVDVISLSVFFFSFRLFLSPFFSWIHSVWSFLWELHFVTFFVFAIKVDNILGKIRFLICFHFLKFLD